MKKELTQVEIQTKIAKIITIAIKDLPIRDEQRMDYHSITIADFAAGIRDTCYFEFEVSFHVSASIDVTRRSNGLGIYSYVVSVSQPSGLRSLSQQQACHNLMGRTLEAAHMIQAAIDEL